MRVEEDGHLFHGFMEDTWDATVPRPPRIKEIISGILLLAARGRGPIPLGKVHSIIHAMKPHESILSGVHFSLTGAVCYSRDIDHAIKSLNDGGFLEIVDGAAFVVERVPGYVNYLSGRFTNSQIQGVHSTSLRFHERLRREVNDPRRHA